MYSAFCFHLAKGFNLANPHAALLVVNNLTNGKPSKYCCLMFLSTPTQVELFELDQSFGGWELFFDLTRMRPDEIRCL